jgi:hypothetical protein
LFAFSISYPSGKAIATGPGKPGGNFNLSAERVILPLKLDIYRTDEIFSIKNPGYFLFSN